MQVELVNDGPVTIIRDSKLKNDNMADKIITIR